LHISREIWTGDKPIPSNLHKSDIEYMNELKSHLEVVRDFADGYTQQAQSTCVNGYNKRAQDESFKIGERAIVSFGDSTNKLRGKWQSGIVVDMYHHAV
jgi:hypothetical protein